MKTQQSGSFKTTQVKNMSGFIFSRVVIASALATIFMVIRVMVFNNPRTGLLDDSPISLALLILSAVLIAYVAVAAFLFSRKLKKEELLSFDVGRIDGFAFFVGAAFLLVQFAINAYDIAINAISIFNGNYPLNRPLIFLSWGSCVFALFSSASFLVQGLLALKGKAVRALRVHVPTIVWAIFMLLNVMMTYPITVSIQPDVEKVILCAMALLFLFYLMGKNSGLVEKKQLRMSLFVRILFPAVGITFSAPYVIAWICGIKDTVISAPYVAVLGLGLMAMMLLFKDDAPKNAIQNE